MSDVVFTGTADDAGVLERLLRAQQAITSSLTEMPPTERLIQDVLQVLCEALGWSLGVAWRPRAGDGPLECLTAWVGDPASGELGAAFVDGTLAPAPAATAAAETWVPAGEDPRLTAAAPHGGVFVLPLRCGEDAVGALELFCPAPAGPDPVLRAWLRATGASLAQYLLRWEAQRSLVERDRALAAARDGVVIADATQPGFPIVYVNRGFERITGYTADEVAGRSCSILQGDDSDPAVIATLADGLAKGRDVEVTLRNYRKNGEPFWNELRLSPVRDTTGAVVQYIGVQHDVTRQHEAMERATFLASHDPLTGLANRSLLQRVASRAAGRSVHQGTAVGLLYLDLDDFKGLNDRFGHLACDTVLCRVADRLREVVRSGDLAARQGGDEFLVVLLDLDPATARATALGAADRIRAAIAAPLDVEGESVSLRASVGVSVLGEDAADVDGLMRHADAAMFRAKRTGRGVNAYVATGVDFTPVREATVVGEAELAELDRLLREDAIRSVYQPIVDLGTREPIAHEALARGPEGSPLAFPDRLFATARVAGRLGELDWACAASAVRGALAAPDRSRPLFVNVEPEALGSPVPEVMARLVEQASEELDIVLEITERTLTARPAELLGLVEAVRARGWGIALDDIGADIRSLALMPLLRPDVIKLDLRLVQDQPTTEVAEIVHAVAAERERTGAVILAEGIETEAHLQTALAMGATVGQGWLFARPGELPQDPAPATVVLERPSERPAWAAGLTPYQAVASQRRVASADKRLLLSVSMNLEQQAAALGECGVILSAFQTAERFTPLTRRRYTLLASDAAFVGALGVDLDPEPAPGVRGAPILAGDPLDGEWSVVVLGPHFAAALVAVDLGDDGPEMERRFEFALTYDRELVIAAAATLMRRINPLPGV